MKFIIILTAAVCLTLTSCFEKKDQAIMKYPITQKVDSIGNYFDVPVNDPYQWLENDTLKETSDWIKAQNDLTFSYLNKIPYRKAVKKRIEEIYNYERLSAPTKEGDFYYFFKNDGLQNHSVLYRKKEENGTPEVFLDPNTFSKDGTTGLDGIYFTKDGSLATYLITEGGSDWRKAVTIKTVDKTIVDDTLVNLKFSYIAWKGNEGFYYSSYDKPTGSHLSSKTQEHKLYFHKLGTPQEQDLIVFGGRENPRRYVSGKVTEDERFLIITASVSTTGNELYVQDLEDRNGSLVTLVNNFDNDHNVVANDGPLLLIQTNLHAPNNRIIAVDFASPHIPLNLQQHFKKIIRVIIQ